MIDAGTDPILADTDGDGLTNGQECEWGTNPSGLDLDGDGHPDGYDTDGDGVSDGAEVAQNSDPTDTGDGGAPNTRIPLSFYFGDPSASHSEKYRLAVTPTVGAGAAPASFSWLNENYGECETKTAMLKPGWKYEVRLYHAGTNISGGSPDYDYELTCGNGSLPSSVVSARCFSVASISALVNSILEIYATDIILKLFMVFLNNPSASRLYSYNGFFCAYPRNPIPVCK